MRILLFILLLLPPAVYAGDTEKIIYRRLALFGGHITLNVPATYSEPGTVKLKVRSSDVDIKDSVYFAHISFKDEDAVSSIIIRTYNRPAAVNQYARIKNKKANSAYLLPYGNENCEAGDNTIHICPGNGTRFIDTTYTEDGLCHHIYGYAESNTNVRTGFLRKKKTATYHIQHGICSGTGNYLFLNYMVSSIEKQKVVDMAGTIARSVQWDGSLPTTEQKNEVHFLNKN